MNTNTPNQDPMYMLATLIEIYRGVPVYLPEFDQEIEKSTLLDVFSAAISFAQQDESRKILSAEIHKCATEGSTIKEQLALIESQHPDLLNAKMVAAAHLMKTMDQTEIKYF